MLCYKCCPAGSEFLASTHMPGEQKYLRHCKCPWGQHGQICPIWRTTGLEQCSSQSLFCKTISQWTDPKIKVYKSLTRHHSMKQDNGSLSPFIWASHWVTAPITFFFLRFFLNLFIFNLRIIALLHFAVFCQTSTWISHRYTYIPSLLNLPPISLPSPPLEVDTEPLFEFSEPYSKVPLAIYFTYGNVSFHVTLFIHLTLSSLLPMFISLFSMSISPLLPCK